MDGHLWRFLVHATLYWAVKAQPNKPNLLFIVSDQYRFDALRFVQETLPWYDDHAKIETPNLDRLAAEGVAFMNAYCQLPSCGPSRATLSTGCTVERTGVQANNIAEGKTAERNPELFQDKIDKLESFEQLLVEERGYVAENYGKWHVPDRFYYTRDGGQQVIEYNAFDFDTDEPKFDPEQRTENAFLRWFKKRRVEDGLDRPVFLEGQLNGETNNWPYYPIQFDDRFGELPSNGRVKNDGIRGWGTLGYNYTRGYFQGLVSRQALSRLAEKSSPFSLMVNLSPPHPPMETSAKYVDYYRPKWEKIFVPPSNSGEPKGSAYYDKKSKRSGFANKADQVQEWTAVYYALAQEIDDTVGALLDELESLGLGNETMVIFTSDHGEFLGAHGFEGKARFYEEATHVPLIMRFPGVMPEGVTVNTPVSHLDIFATIMDYLNAGNLDNSDGHTLRPFIEGKAFNAHPSEGVVVAELDQRYPINDFELSGANGEEPNFMIRYGDYKLMMPKMASSPVPDMLFDLSSDPFEMNNLLKDNSVDWVIGKAEQLKLLLVDWMKDKDGLKNYYSLPQWNGYQGDGDIQEITKRRTWKTIDYWQSDRVLGFSQPTNGSNSEFIRHEYLYVGRTTPGQLKIRVQITGRDRNLFTCSPTRASIREGESVRVTVSYMSDRRERIRDLKANVEVKVKKGGVNSIPIVESQY